MSVVSEQETGNGLLAWANQFEYLDFPIGRKRWIPTQDYLRLALLVGYHFAPIGPHRRCTGTNPGLDRAQISQCLTHHFHQLALQPLSILHVVAVASRVVQSQGWSAVCVSGAEKQFR